MMETKRTYLPIAAIAAVALVAAACSSSDNKRAAMGGVEDDTMETVEPTDTVEPTEPTEPMEPTRTDAEKLTDALDELVAAQTAYDALVAEGADVDPAALGAAFLDLEAAKAAAAIAEALDGNQATLAAGIKIATAIMRDDAVASTIAEYDAADTAFEVDGGEVTERTTDDDAVTDYAATDGAVADIDDWTGSMSMATRVADDASTMDMDETVTHTVVSYTNRTPNAAALYSAYYTGSSAPPGHIDWRGMTSVDDDGVLTLEDAVTDASRSLFGDTNFGITARNQTLTVEDDADTTGVMENEIEGMFHGIPGTFICEGTCMVVSDDDGLLSMLTGAWTFMPAEQEMGDDPYMVAGVAEDDFYLDFGYWIVEGPDDTYTVGTYGTSNDTYGSAVADVTGTAEYAGPATGLYMRKRVDADGDPTSAMSGQFTAMANLMATFGQVNDENNEGIIPPNLLNSITGSVSKFRDGYGNMIDADWMVELMKGDITEADGTFAGMTTGEGSYSGTFHGSDDTATTDVVEKPSAATGVFDAHFDNGHVAGAFGALLQEE